MSGPKKKPRLAAGLLSLLSSQFRGLSNLLIVLAALAALLLAGPVALALRILLLLSGFLATTLLLAGVLTLLTRILVLLLRHFGKLPCWTSERR